MQEYPGSSNQKENGLALSDITIATVGFPGGSVKNPPAIQETWVRSRSLKDPLEEGRILPTAVFLTREFHG